MIATIARVFLVVAGVLLFAASVGVIIGSFWPMDDDEEGHR